LFFLMSDTVLLPITNISMITVYNIMSSIFILSCMDKTTLVHLLVHVAVQVAILHLPAAWIPTAHAHNKPRVHNLVRLWVRKIEGWLYYII
jgi:hypothetical protein